ncbi:MAG: hypothetical protein ACKOTB_15070, partial [Planctomycetia bacterium]
EQARHKLGWSHAMRKDHAAAAAAFREQLAAAANGSLAADAQAMLGESLFQTGDYAAAAKPLAAALAKPESLSSDDLRGPRVAPRRRMYGPPRAVEGEPEVRDGSRAGAAHRRLRGAGPLRRGVGPAEPRAVRQGPGGLP